MPLIAAPADTSTTIVPRFQAKGCHTSPASSFRRSLELLCRDHAVDSNCAGGAYVSSSLAGNISYNVKAGKLAARIDFQLILQESDTHLADFIVKNKEIRNRPQKAQLRRCKSRDSQGDWFEHSKRHYVQSGGNMVHLFNSGHYFVHQIAWR